MHLNFVKAMLGNLSSSLIAWRCQKASLCCPLSSVPDIQAALHALPHAVRRADACTLTKAESVEAAARISLSLKNCNLHGANAHFLYVVTITSPPRWSVGRRGGAHARGLGTPCLASRRRAPQSKARRRQTRRCVGIGEPEAAVANGGRHAMRCKLSAVTKSSRAGGCQQSVQMLQAKDVSICTHRQLIEMLEARIFRPLRPPGRSRA
eukprot:6190342-Pleurochrysis_carterae.AAC.4